MGPIESQHCPRPTLLYVFTPKKRRARSAYSYSGRTEGIGDLSKTHFHSPGFFGAKISFFWIFNRRSTNQFQSKIVVIKRVVNVQMKCPDPPLDLHILGWVHSRAGQFVLNPAWTIKTPQFYSTETTPVSDILVLLIQLMAHMKPDMRGTILRPKNQGGSILGRANFEKNPA